MHKQIEACVRPLVELLNVAGARVWQRQCVELTEPVHDYLGSCAWGRSVMNWPAVQSLHGPAERSPHYIGALFEGLLSLSGPFITVNHPERVVPSVDAAAAAAAVSAVVATAFPSAPPMRLPRASGVCPFDERTAQGSPLLWRSLLQLERERTVASAPLTKREWRGNPNPLRFEECLRIRPTADGRNCLDLFKQGLRHATRASTWEYHLENFNRARLPTLTQG